MSKPTYKTKVHSLRMTPEKIDKFHTACNSLPFTFKPNELLNSYIDYIISSAEQYKKTGHIKMGFLSYDKSIVILNLEGQQRSFDFCNELDE